MSSWAIINAMVHSVHELGKITGLEKPTRRCGDALETVVLRTLVNEWLDPMKEAPSFEGAFFVTDPLHVPMKA